nr:MAG TPA: hypothetical protein [Caudoviricetes sp.]
MYTFIYIKRRNHESYCNRSTDMNIPGWNITIILAPEKIQGLK